MNYLITGGCGFIGRNLIKSLKERDEKIFIRVIDNFSVGTPEDLNYTNASHQTVQVADAVWQAERIEVVQGDILDETLAFSVTKGADVIIHLAANTGVEPSVKEPRMDCTTNVLGILNYLEAARKNGVQRFVFASSGAPIGECTPPIHEEMPCHPVSPYGASKLAGEAYCSAYFNSFGVDTVALRFGNVYGPGSSHKSSVVAKFIRQAMNGETLEIYGDGTQTRDFIFTEDLVNAIYQAAVRVGIGGEIFQIATNKETTVLEMTNILVKNLKEEGISDFDVIHGKKRVGDVMRNFSDTSKAMKKLKWQAESNLEQGLKKTIEWFEVRG